jgi:radical SAM superfamily enzyme YgiQ (UPF0313 family)
MAWVHERYGTPHFHFMDDAMTIDRKRMLEICELLAERGLDVTWSMMTRVDRVDDKLLGILRRAGCVQIDYGIESGHPETLKRIHKPHNVARAKQTVVQTAACGIRASVFFILGFPWDTVQTIEVTEKLMKELAPHVARFHPAIASVLIPFPGTEIYDQFKGPTVSKTGGSRRRRASTHRIHAATPTTNRSSTRAAWCSMPTSSTTRPRCGTRSKKCSSSCGSTI